MSGLVWEDPPPAERRKRSQWGQVADQLRARPHTWARIRECRSNAAARSTATQIRRGRRDGMEPAGSFEAESRTVDGRHFVYARFVGEAAS